MEGSDRHCLHAFFLLCRPLRTSFHLPVVHRPPCLWSGLNSTGVGFTSSGDSFYLRSCKRPCVICTIRGIFSEFRHRCPIDTSLNRGCHTGCSSSGIFISSFPDGRSYYTPKAFTNTALSFPPRQEISVPFPVVCRGGQRRGSRVDTPSDASGTAMAVGWRCGSSPPPSSWQTFPLSFPDSSSAGAASTEYHRAGTGRGVHE